MEINMKHTVERNSHGEYYQLHVPADTTLSFYIKPVLSYEATSTQSIIDNLIIKSNHWHEIVLQDIVKNITSDKGHLFTLIP